MHLVFTKINDDAGEPLEHILSRKEAERQAGDRVFWWGFGHTAGDSFIQAVRDVARPMGRRLPVRLSRAKTTAQEKDKNPPEAWVWTQYEDEGRNVREIPPNVLVTSRGVPGKHEHYALVCHSPIPIHPLGNCPPFDHSLCLTTNNRLPPQQSTQLLWANPLFNHRNCPDGIGTGLDATLIGDCVVKLVGRRVSALSRSERDKISTWKGSGWVEFVKMIRR